MGGEAGREDGRVVSCYNRYDEKSTTRFSLTEEAVEESVAVRGLAVEAEPTTEVSLANKKESNGEQRGDRVAAKLSCCKLEGVELLSVPTTGWLDKNACGDGRGNVWGCYG